MAGIAGIFCPEIRDNKCVNDMLKAISHRGPDNFYNIIMDNCVLGCCESNTGSKRKRVCTRDNKVGIVFDGVLLNKEDNHKNDAEMLLSLYTHQGRNCFSQIDGVFAIAIASEEELILARDHVGSRPLFYGVKDRTVYFASEIKALFTATDAIEELPPGKIFSSKTGLSDFNRYEPEIPSFKTSKEASNVLKDLLSHAVAERMKGGAVKSVALSGGLDSSIIAALALKIDPELILFTIGLEGCPDVENARRVTEYLGAQNRHLIYIIREGELEQAVYDAVWYLESFEEDCISGCVANIFASRLAAGFSKCCLCGEGADELFGGYHLLKEIKELEQREKAMEKLVNIAYNTGLRRLDRGWLCNSVDYRTPFLDSHIIAFSKKVPIDWKIHGEKQTEKWILREAFRDMLPQEVVERKKYRFAGGTNIDDIMDTVAAKYISQDKFEKQKTTETGYRLNSPKELWYYKIFKEYFPADAFEKQVVRWDPFKR